MDQLLKENQDRWARLFRWQTKIWWFTISHTFEYFILDSEISPFLNLGQFNFLINILQHKENISWARFGYGLLDCNLCSSWGEKTVSCSFLEFPEANTHNSSLLNVGKVTTLSEPGALDSSHGESRTQKIHDNKNCCLSNSFSSLKRVPGACPSLHGVAGRGQRQWKFQHSGSGPGVMTPPLLY